MNKLTQQEVLSFEDRIRAANYIATLKHIMKDLEESCADYVQTKHLHDLAVSRRQVLLDEYVDDPTCGEHFTNG